MELNAFVKKKGFAPTGGQAKILIRSGQVILNGAVETRNKKQISPGDSVIIMGKEFIVD